MREGDRIEPGGRGEISQAAIYLLDSAYGHFRPLSLCYIQPNGQFFAVTVFDKFSLLDLDFRSSLLYSYFEVQNSTLLFGMIGNQGQDSSRSTITDFSYTVGI